MATQSMSRYAAELAAYRHCCERSRAPQHGPKLTLTGCGRDCADDGAGGVPGGNGGGGGGTQYVKLEASTRDLPMSVSTWCP